MSFVLSSNRVNVKTNELVASHRFFYGVDPYTGFPLLSVTTYLRRQMGMTVWRSLRGGLAAIGFWAGHIAYADKDTQRKFVTFIKMSGPLYCLTIPGSAEEMLGWPSGETEID